MPFIAIYHYEIVFRALIDCAVYLDLQISIDKEETFQHVRMGMLFYHLALLEPGYCNLSYIAARLIV